MSRTTKIWIAGFALLCLAVGGIVLRAILRRPAPAAAVEQMSAEEIAAWDALAQTSLRASMSVDYREMQKLRRNVLVGAQQRQSYLNRMVEAFNGNPLKKQLVNIKQEVDAPIREVDFFKFPEEAAPHLAQLRSLRRLHFMAGDLRGKRFAAVGKLTGLETLRVSGAELWPSDLAKLKNLHRLAELEVGVRMYTVNDDARRALLDELSPAEHRQLANHLAARPHDSQRIETAILLDRALLELGALPSLRKLRLDGAWVTNVGLAAISRMPQLEEIEVQVLNFDEESSRLIAGMSHLKHVHIGVVTDELLRQLAQNSQLESLRGVAGGVTSEGIAILARMTSLRSLQLGQLPLDDDQLAELAALPHLRLLDVRSRRATLTPDGIARFQQLKPDCELLWRMDQEPRLE